MDDDVDYTLWCGNLSSKVTEELLYELFLQAGPLDKVRIPHDNNTGKNKTFAFVTFKHVESIPYTMNLMNGIRLFGQQLKLQARPGSTHEQNMRQHQAMAMNPMTVPPGGFHSRPQPFHPFDTQANGGFSRSYSAPQMHGSSMGSSHDDRRSRYESRSSHYDRSPNRYEDGSGLSRGYEDRGRDRSGYRSQGGSPSRRERDSRNDERSRDMDMRRQSVLNMQHRQLEHRRVIMEQQRRTGDPRQAWQPHRPYRH